MRILLSHYFGAAICNTGCSRKPQNQYSIRQCHGKSIILFLIGNELVSSEIIAARDMPIFLLAESGYDYGFRRVAERTKGRAIDSLGLRSEKRL